MKLANFLYKQGASVGLVHGHQLAFKIVETPISFSHINFRSSFPIEKVKKVKNLLLDVTLVQDRVKHTALNQNGKHGVK